MYIGLRWSRPCLPDTRLEKNVEINEDNSKTINGLITEYLDQIPQANLCIEIDDYRFEIIEIDNNFISKIKIKKA